MTRPTIRRPNIGLLRAERRIADADGSGVAERWRWGQAALADPTVCNPAGSLRRGRGVADALIAAAKAAGLALSEREIQRRLQLARAYPTEAVSRHAVARYGTWRDLSDAGFPPVDGVTEDPPGTGQLALVDDDGQPTLDADRPEPLFPPMLAIGRRQVPLSHATLRQLGSYTDRLAARTAAHAVRDERRAARVAELLAAVDGRTDATVAEAEAALAGGAA